MASSPDKLGLVAPHTGSLGFDDVSGLAPGKTGPERTPVPSDTVDSPLALSDAEARTVLQPEDIEVFFAALDAPPEPTEALRKAFAHYRNTVDSR